MIASRHPSEKVRFVLFLCAIITCFAIGPPFHHMKEMTPQERSHMRTRRIRLGKLNRLAQESIRCERCHGSGSITKKIRVLLRGHSTILQDRIVGCPLCQGVKVHPIDSFNRRMTEYFRAKRAFEKDYPFKAPVKSGLCVNVFQQIKKRSAIWNVNEYAIRHMASGSRLDDEVFLIAVRVVSAGRASTGKGMIARCFMLDKRSPLEGVAVSFYLPNPKFVLRENTALLVLAWDEGHLNRKKRGAYNPKKLATRTIKEIASDRMEDKSVIRNLFTIIYFKELRL